VDGVNTCFVWLEWTAKGTMVLMELIDEPILKSIASQSQANHKPILGFFLSFWSTPQHSAPLFLLWSKQWLPIMTLSFFNCLIFMCF